jgi:hypothetical protein
MFLRSVRTAMSVKLALVCGVFVLASCRFAKGQSISAADKGSIEKSVEKGIAYLAVETPKWQVEHRCASCHHQGSAVRALLVARAKGRLKSDEVLATSLDWLVCPEKWGENHGDPQASDQALAELQFGGSLLAAQKQFPDRFREPLSQLAKQLAKRQGTDGKFDLENVDGLASPITLGPILLTGMARDVFEAHGQAFREEAKRANGWLRGFKPRNTLEGASLLISLGHGEENKSVRATARKIVLESAHERGGFGPYASAPPEVFDTALAVIALSRDEEAAKHRELIEKGKRQMVLWQLEDGSWEETTRPRGGVSYAHRVSTTAWVVEALLEGVDKK